MIGDRVVFGELVALPLARDDVQELRALQLLDVGERRHERIEVVAVDRPDVVEAELFEKRRRRHHALHVLLGAARELPDAHALEQMLARPPGARVHPAGEKAREVIGERAHGTRDRHLVVVEDDQQIDIHGPGIVHRLISHACRHRAVADHRDAVALLALRLGGDRHAERGGDRGR